MRTTVDNRLKNGLNATFIEQDNEILQETRKQLDEYFDMSRWKVNRIWWRIAT